LRSVRLGTSLVESSGRSMYKVAKIRLTSIERAEGVLESCPVTRGTQHLERGPGTDHQGRLTSSCAFESNSEAGVNRARKNNWTRRRAPPNVGLQGQFGSRKAYFGKPGLGVSKEACRESKGEKINRTTGEAKR